MRPLRVRSLANVARDQVLGFFDETFVNDARFVGLFRDKRRRRLQPIDPAAQDLAGLWAEENPERRVQGAERNDCSMFAST